LCVVTLLVKRLSAAVPRSLALKVSAPAGEAATAAEASLAAAVRTSPAAIPTAAGRATQEAGGLAMRKEAEGRAATAEANAVGRARADDKKAGEGPAAKPAATPAKKKAAERRS